MSIVHCPKCGDQVSIPFGASDEAVVQCPLCHAEYRLEDALDQLPPTLIVLDDPLATTEPAETDEEESHVPAFAPLGGFQLDTEESKSVAESGLAVSESDDAPAFDFENGSAPATPATPRVRHSRPPRRRSSPLRQVLQVVAGGVAGVVIAQLILLWIPVNIPNTQRDPTGFVRKYCKFLPFIVPASFTEATETGDVVADKSASEAETLGAARVADPRSDIPDFQLTDPAQLDAASNTAPNPRKSKKRNRTNSNADIANNAGNDSQPAANDQEQATTGEPSQGMERNNNFLSGSVDVPSLDLDSPMGSASFDLPNVKPPSILPPSAEPKPPASPNPSPTERLTDCFANALNANVAIDTTESPDRATMIELYMEFYRSFAALGEQLSVVDQRDPDLAEAVRNVDDLLQSIGTQQNKLAVIGKAAGSWMTNSRSNDGVALYGIVQSVDKQGAYYQTVLKIASSDERSVTVLNQFDPTADYAPGDQLLILGTFVEEPAKNLQDYAGDLEQVVVDGRHYLVQ